MIKPTAFHQRKFEQFTINSFTFYIYSPIILQKKQHNNFIPTISKNLQKSKTTYLNSKFKLFNPFRLSNRKLCRKTHTLGENILCKDVHIIFRARKLECKFFKEYLIEKCQSP